MYGISKPYRDPSFSIDFYSVTMHWINEESKEISPAIKPSKVLISDAVKRLSLISSGEPSAVAIFDDLNMAAYASTRSQLLIMFLYDSQNVSVPFYIENVLHNPSSGSHKTSILMGASSIYVEQHSYPELKTWIEYYHSNLEVTSFKIYYNVRSDSAHCKNPLAICSGLSYLVESLTRDFEKFADLRIELLEWTFMVMLFEDAHHSQTVALNSALYRFKGVVQWLFNFDLDEYVIDSPDNISSLRHFLSTHNDVPGLILGSRWAVMEKSGESNFPVVHYPFTLDSFFTNRIRSCDPSYCHEYCQRSKYIVKTDLVSLLGVHKPSLDFKIYTNHAIYTRNHFSHHSSNANCSSVFFFYHFINQERYQKRSHWISDSKNSWTKLLNFKDDLQYDVHRLMRKHLIVFCMVVFVSVGACGLLFLLCMSPHRQKSLPPSPTRRWRDAP